MKVWIPDTSEYADINHLQEIKSPILIDQNAGPHPDGLVSNDIFGYNVKSRKLTYAYIDLKKHFINPEVYKSIRRFFRSIDDIAAGKKTFSLNKERRIVEDPNGETGLDWLYSVWDKIKWDSENDTVSRKDRIDVIKNYPKDTIWQSKFIVIPAFYRDILNSSTGGETGDLNGLYVKLIRQVSMLGSSAMFDFAFYNIEFQIQYTMIEIYDYFKSKLEKKTGMIRKSLMSKSVDYGSRTIITAPIYTADRYEDMAVTAEYMAVPLTQICTTLYPQMIREIKNWFERNIFSVKKVKVNNKDIGEEFLEVFKAEEKFTDQYINKMLSNYVSNPASRFDKILVPSKGPNGDIIERPITLFYERIEDSSKSAIENRDMCWTDLLYILACEAIKNKIVIFTRYPELGTFFNKIHVVCTNQSMCIKIGETEYKWYPIINYNLTHEQLTSYFKDSVSFDNCYCAAASADYDGDQVTIKILWSEEANKEAEEFIYSKQNILNSNGMSNRRTIESEAVQTFYVMTKEPRKDQKLVSEYDVKNIIDQPISKMTYEWFNDLLADTYINGKVVPAKYKCYDKIILKKSMYKFIPKDIETTIGRLLFNRYVIESCNFYGVVDYINEPVTSKRLGKLENKLSEAFLDDKIDGHSFIEYISRRDFLGLKLNAMLTTSYSEIMMATPKKVQDLKKKLIKEHEVELEAGDINVTDKIEKTLLAAAKEEIKDDPANDLFDSGARGSFNNNYKLTNIMRGAVYNRIKDRYEILTTCLNDGVSIKDSTGMANALVEGQYPKSCGTRDSGYLQKELIQLMQTEIVDKEGSDCHSKQPINVKLTEDNISGFLFRYIVENGKYVIITKENMPKYIGKTVKMRSPLSCINKNGTCNICVGNLPYKMNMKNAGLSASSIGTRLTALNMKGFHDATLKFNDLNLEEFMTKM